MNKDAIRQNLLPQIQESIEIVQQQQDQDCPHCWICSVEGVELERRGIVGECNTWDQGGFVVISNDNICV